MAQDRKQIVNTQAVELNWNPIKSNVKNMVSFEQTNNNKTYRINLWYKKLNKTSIRAQGKDFNFSLLDVNINSLKDALITINDEITQPEGQ